MLATKAPLFQRKKVVVVTDDSLVMTMVACALSMYSYDVVASERAPEAFKKIFDDMHVNLVVMTPCKTDRYALKFLKAIRSTGKLNFTPVLILADEDCFDKQIEWKMAGASAWLARPFTYDQLIRTIDLLVF